MMLRRSISNFAGEPDLLLSLLKDAMEPVDPMELSERILAGEAEDESGIDVLDGLAGLAMRVVRWLW